MRNIADVEDKGKKGTGAGQVGLNPGIHGVIAIHGISGNLKRGEILAAVTNSLADTLLDSPIKDGKTGCPVYPEIKREMDMDTDPPSVTLRITAPDRKVTTTWVCKEAFWADAFPPPAASSVLRWLLKQMYDQLKYIREEFLRDPANNGTFDPGRPRGQRELSYKTGRGLSAIYRIELLAMGALLLPLIPIVPILLFLIWPLHWMPRFGFLAGFLEWLHMLDPFLSSSLGDVKRYIEHGVWSASARGRLEKVVVDMLEDGTIDDITIVAHSMGCVVTYDALIEGGSIADEVTKNPKKITFVSVGSGINQVLPMADNSNLYAQDRFKRPLAKSVLSNFSWVDIYARFDPVPAGDLDKSITDRAGIDLSKVKRRRVVNLDNPIRDHSYYWQNKDLVMPRIIRAINDDKKPWLEAGITDERLSRHYKKVAILVTLRLAMGAIVVACLVAAVLNLLGPLSSLPMSIPLFTTLLAVGLYKVIRSWKVGDIS